MLLLLHAITQMFVGAVVAHATLPLASSRSHDQAIWRLTAALYVDLLSAVPLIAYQARLWPAYAFGYTVDPLLSPWLDSCAPWFALGALIVMPLCFALGFLVCQLAASRGRRWLSIVPVWLTLLVAMALFGWHYEEFTVIGDFPAYWRGGGSVAHKHLHVQLLVGVYALGAFILCFMRSRRARAVTP